MVPLSLFCRNTDKRLLFSRLWSAERNEALRGCVGTAVPWVLAALVLCIFSSNASELTKHPSAVFPLILLAVFLFFLLTWLCGEFFGLSISPYSPAEGSVGHYHDGPQFSAYVRSCDGSLSKPASNLCRPHYRNACRIPSPNDSFASYVPES